jgi:formylglycine-generating enzyme required for sulfatase activity
MGGPEEEIEMQHRRRVGRSFAIMTHEVTVDQYLRFRPEHDYFREYAPELSCPVQQVTWYEAAEYCNWLSEREGLREDEWCYLPNSDGEYAEGMQPAPEYLEKTGYRLPTEAEWEYACRAGTVTSRYYGETGDLLDEYAWCAINSHERSMCPVGNAKPNGLGLFDMLGNAAEWCQDRYSAYPISTDGNPSENAPNAQEIKDQPPRVARGGAFAGVPRFLRAALRAAYHPSDCRGDVGFRVARTVHGSSADNGRVANRFNSWQVAPTRASEIRTRP